MKENGMDNVKPDSEAQENPKTQETDVATAKPAAQKSGVRNYDFRRPRHLSLDQMRNVQRVHAGAAEQIQSRLSRYLGVQCDTRLESAEEVSFEILSESLPKHIYVAVLDLSPLHEKGLLILDARLCLAFVDRMLGGRCKTPPEARALTAIDQAASESAVELILRCLRDAWREIYPAKMAVVERRNEVEGIRIVPRGEPTLAVTLNFGGEVGEGTLRLALPLAALKAAAETGAQRNALKPSAEKAGALQDQVLRSLERASLDVVAQIGVVDVPLRTMMKISTGDVLRLQRTVESPVLLHVGGRPAFWGRMGLRGRKKAVQITGRVDPNEEG